MLSCISWFTITNAQRLVMLPVIMVGCSYYPVIPALLLLCCLASRHLLLWIHDSLSDCTYLVDTPDFQSLVANMVDCY